MERILEYRDVCTAFPGPYSERAMVTLDDGYSFPVDINTPAHVFTARCLGKEYRHYEGGPVQTIVGIEFVDGKIPAGC